MQQIPVYVFTGFLDSGKTKFIQETLEDPRFNDGDRTLILAFEEGEEEYDFSTYPNQNAAGGGSLYALPGRMGSGSGGHVCGFYYHYGL